MLDPTVYLTSNKQHAKGSKVKSVYTIILVSRPHQPPPQHLSHNEAVCSRGSKAAFNVIQ